MLKFMRDRMGKTFLALVVGGISLVFVFFGVFPEMGGGASGSTVASVGSEKITSQQLMNAVNRELENYRAMGMDVPAELVQNIKQGTLESLIQGKLLLVEARRLGIQVSDQEVSAEIQKLPYFQDKEKKTFSVTLYRDLLAQNGLTPGQFEEDVRGGLVHQRMQKFLTDRIRVTPGEVEREFRISNELRSLSFVRLSREDAMKKMVVDAKEMEAFLADKSREAQINAFYAQNNVRFNQPEKVCARHILRRAPPGASGSDKAKETVPAEFLNLKPTPGNFASLASKHSDDPGSQKNGGDLDCFARGVMDKAFEDAAFSLPLGKVSAPVKSQFGWHYILVSKKTPAVNQSIEKVKNEIVSELIKRDRLAEIRKINLAEAERVAGAWGSIKKEVTGDFNGLEGAIPKIGRAEEILRAAFDPKAKIQSAPQIFEAQGGVIVAMVKERKSPDVAKLEKDRDMHTRTLRERKLRAFIPAWMEDVKTRTKVSYNSRLLGQI